MTIYGLLFKFFGWAIGLGLILGEFTYYTDGSSDGWTVAAGWAILGWWAWSTFGRRMLRARKESSVVGLDAPRAASPRLGASNNLTTQRDTSRQRSASPSDQGPDEANVQRLTDALDGVLDDAVGFADIDPQEWTPKTTGVFVAFTRLLLAEAITQDGLARRAGGNSQELPYLQLLAGFPQAMKGIGEAWQANSDNWEGDVNPIEEVIIPMAVPIQRAIDVHVRQEPFEAVQSMVYDE